MLKFSLNNIKKNIASVGVIAVLVTIDQVIKYYVVTLLKPIETHAFIPGFIQLHYLENDGAMMGFMGGKTEIMTVASLICMIIVILLLFTDFVKSKIVYICIVMIAAGGIGNIIDRLIRGFVVDYIEYLFMDFYIFNFADCLITVGVFALIIYQIALTVREYKEKKGHAQND